MCNKIFIDHNIISAHYNIVGRIIQGRQNRRGVRGLGVTPLNKYHPALTMHQYTLIK